MTGRQLGLIIGGLALSVAACFEPFQTLLFGWVGFLLRVLPRFTADRATVFVSVAAAVLFTAGLHWAGRAWRSDWKWRYSAGLTVILFVMFAAAVAMVGTFHMAAWYATAKEPVRVPTPIGGAAARIKSSNNMKQIGLGVHNYVGVYGRVPPGGTFDSSGRALHGWEIHIADFTGWAVPRELDRNKPWDDPQNARYFRFVDPTLINPSLLDAPVEDANGFGYNHYSANSHLFRTDQTLKFAEITDGLANTLMLGEINANFQPWGKPMNVRDPGRGINRSPYGFGGPPGAGGALLAMADGHVRFIRDNVTRDVLRALATPDGGEEIDQSVLEDR